MGEGAGWTTGDRGGPVLNKAIMRIALLMKRYSLQRGGGEYDLVRLSTSLVGRGHEVHLFVNDVEGEPNPRLTIHHVPMIRLWAPLKILSFACNAPREVDHSGIKFDVVHAMTQAYPSDLFWNGGGLQINWLRTRYPNTSLNRLCLNPRHATNLWVEKQVFKPGNYRYVVALTQMEREQIVGHYRVPQERFLVIPNGIDPERLNLGMREKYRTEMRRELGLKDLAPPLKDLTPPAPLSRKERGEVPLLVFVGTDGLRKGLPQLLQALAGVQPPFAGLLAIAGNDPPSRWEGLVSQLGLTGKVVFRGREPVIERLYAAADLVVLASLFDGYGNVIPEAMACGCPVLTTKSVGAADFVEHGKTGWVLKDCNDIPAYSRCLEEALYSADLETMGRAAASAVQPYTWNWTVDRLEEVYWRITEEKERS